MNGSRINYFFSEAWHEMRMGLRTPMVPLVIVGLTIYMVLVFLNADYMRMMGAVDVYRNSAHITYLMASGQCLWLYFAWAWLFAQPVMRDQTARLHEVVLATPAPLRLTLMARFAGALAIAVLMGASVHLGFLLAPLLAAVGVLPAESVGPQPWAALAWSIMLFTLPNALAAGMVFLCAAVWTRSTAGPFAAAAVFALVWMAAMIILRGGGVDLAAGSIMDPSGYSEAERQSFAWTPIEKRTALIELTDLLIYNRLLWLLLPLAMLIWVLARIKREQLAVVGKAIVDEGGDEVMAETSSRGYTIPQIQAPVWFRAVLSEAVWQFKMVTKGFGIRLALVMLLTAGALGAWVNFVGHVDGPLVPTPQGLVPFVVEFFFIIIVFVVAGFVGVLMRRDDRLGYDELVDAGYAPLAVRVAAKCLAALALIALICLIPALSSIIVTAFGAPAALDIAYPFAYMFLTLFPALAEVGAMAFIAHALFRHSGTAYVASVLIAFIAIINHELSVVEYPPAQIAIPTHASPSELVGWSPWLPMVFSMFGLKMAVVTLMVGIGWLVWRRGTALTLADRTAAARSRIVGAPGVVVAASLAAFVVFAGLLNARLVVEGEYESVSGGIAGDAGWERAWWHQAEPFTVEGGTVEAELHPSSRSGTVEWRLRRLRTERLHGTLPHGVSLDRVTVAGVPQEVRQDGDHFAVALPQCAGGCDLTMGLTIGDRGWPLEDAPWLHGSGVWLRAENILPTLGHDPRRLVRSIGDRRDHELPESLPAMPEARALASMTGVAPLGEWRWRVKAPDGFTVGEEGRLAGMLDFAYAWLPEPPETDSARYIVGPARRPQLASMTADLDEMKRCVARETGRMPSYRYVLQSPRESGDIGVHGSILWAPEDAAWEATGEAVGGWQRRFNLARAMGRQTLVQGRDLRVEPGAEWLLEGAAGWIALRCLERHSGFEAALALRRLHANELSEHFAESDEPINTTADAHADWLALYASLALDNWGAAGEARTPAAVAAALRGRGEAEPLVAALERVFGADASSLLGPPKSGDIVVIRAGDELDLSVNNWVWASGGWRSITTPEQVLLRDEGEAGFRWIDTASPNLPSGAQGLLIDVTTGFERTVDDNQL